MNKHNSRDIPERLDEPLDEAEMEQDEYDEMELLERLESLREDMEDLRVTTLDEVVERIQELHMRLDKR